MKILIVKLSTYCLILTILFSCAEKKETDYAIVSGVLLSAADKEIGMGSMDHGIIRALVKPIRKSISINEKGQFSDTIFLEKSRKFIFYVDRSVVYLNLKPGDKMHLTADAKDLPETIKYSGIGAKENNYMLKYLKLDEAFNEALFDKLKLDENKYKQFLDDYRASIYQLLDSSIGLTEVFIARQKRDLHYDIVSNYLFYAEHHAAAISDDNYKPSQNFLDIVSSVDMENSKELMENFHYGLLLREYYKFKFSQNENCKDDEQGEFIQYLAKTITDKKVKEELLYYFGKINISGAKDTQLCYTTLVQNISKEEYKKEFLEIYNQLLLTKPGQISPLFTDFVNIDGTTSSLIDFRGKFVYINTWATWSKSSAEEIPYLKDKEKQYQDKNIAFISLSVDYFTNIEKWKQFVKENKIGGIQLIANKYRKLGFIWSYRIEGIPRYILIDPEGKIVSENAPKPSDPKFDELMKKVGF